MANESIRLKAKGAGIPFWKIANALGISEATMTRLMRTELNPEKKTEIESIINDLSEKGTRHE